MRSGALRVSWYRVTATFGRRWGAYLTVALLVGLIGGLAMGSIAGARRTQSSYPAYLASTNASDLQVVTSVLNPEITGPRGAGYDPGIIRTLARLPHVTSVVSASGLDVMPVDPHGAPLTIAGFQPSAGNGLGSDDGEGFRQDRLSVVEGRLPDPARADEIAMNVQVASVLHVHVGERYSMGIYTNAQTLEPAFGTAAVMPYRVAHLTLVATVLQAGQLIEDDVDNSQSLAFFTPAFTRPLLRCCANYTGTALRISGGPRVVAAVATRVRGLLQTGFPSPTVTADQVAKAERTVRPESIALGVFGGIAALAALLIAAQVIGRQLRTSTQDLAILRALGASPAAVVGEFVVGMGVAVVVGALVAVVVAVGLSPVSVLGPVPSVQPPGVFFDWTVLGAGLAVLVVGLGGLTVAFAVVGAPQRRLRRMPGAAHGSVIARAAAASGLAPAAVTGIRFALEPGEGRNAVPVRSAILGAVLALVVVVGTITFGASLHTLVSQPRLYGWNWDVDLAAGGGVGNAPGAQAARLLGHDPAVRAWSGVYFSGLIIDGRPVPVIGERPGTAVQPPVLSGRRLETPGQVVLGAVTLTQLHKHLGDTVVVGTGADTRVHLRIVGTATMPTLGSTGTHLEMGTGALVSSDLIPGPARNPFSDPQPGPENIFVDLKPGADRAGALRSLERVAGALSNNFNFGVSVQTQPLRPAEIVNYKTMGTTPTILGAALGAGAAGALALTLVASVRRRRRDLAVLKTLGFTGRQLAATIAWQSTVAVALGTLIGVPVGIVVGRTLWEVFAHEIHAVPASTVPPLAVAMITVGALVLANVVAAVPGRIAARTPASLALRAE